MMMQAVLCLFLLSASAAAGVPQASIDTLASTRGAVIDRVQRIQRADYEGDRAALNQLYSELSDFVDEPELASRVRYWRGFAKWRRGINGFNETPTPKDLAQDFAAAESEFDAALLRDSNFVDAKVGAASCQMYRLFLEGAFGREKDPARLKAIMWPASQLLQEAKTAAPDNPRLLWVMGPNEWSRPAAVGGGQEKAMETYQRGLATIRAQKSGGDGLEPAWGEPELLMNLAWSNLNRTQPDLAAAERYAQSALQMVPYWHYVRDILLPQIRDAQKKPSK